MVAAAWVAALFGEPLLCCCRERLPSKLLLPCCVPTAENSFTSPASPAFQVGKLLILVLVDSLVNLVD